MMHAFLNEHQRLVDAAAWLCAGVAAVSLLQQLAFIVTILAGMGSLSLVGMRWYDRLKHGRTAE